MKGLKQRFDGLVKTAVKGINGDLLVSQKAKWRVYNGDLVPSQKHSEILQYVFPDVSTHIMKSLNGNILVSQKHSEEVKIVMSFNWSRSSFLTYRLNFK